MFLKCEDAVPRSLSWIFFCPVRISQLFSHVIDESRLHSLRYVIVRLVTLWYVAWCRVETFRVVSCILLGNYSCYCHCIFVVVIIFVGIIVVMVACRYSYMWLYLSLSLLLHMLEMWELEDVWDDIWTFVKL